MQFVCSNSFSFASFVGCSSTSIATSSISCFRSKTMEVLGSEAAALWRRFEKVWPLITRELLGAIRTNEGEFPATADAAAAAIAVEDRVDAIVVVVSFPPCQERAREALVASVDVRCRGMEEVEGWCRDGATKCRPAPLFFPFMSLLSIRARRASFSSSTTRDGRACVEEREKEAPPAALLPMRNVNEGKERRLDGIRAEEAFPTSSSSNVVLLHLPFPLLLLL